MSDPYIRDASICSWGIIPSRALLSDELKRFADLIEADMHKRFPEGIGSFGRLQVLRGLHEAIEIAADLHNNGEGINAYGRYSIHTPDLESGRGKEAARGYMHQLLQQSSLTEEEEQRLREYSPGLYRRWLRIQAANKKDSTSG